MAAELSTTPRTAESENARVEEGQKISKRAADIATLINAQLREHFPVPEVAEEHLPLTERNEAAFALARREADLERSKSLVAELQMNSPHDVASIKHAKDSYHHARERYQRQAEYIARRTGASPEDGLRNFRDSMYRSYKKGASVLRQHPIAALGGLGAAVYGMSGFFTGPGLVNAGTALSSAYGGSGFLPWMVHGGIVVGAGAVGYGLGKIIGRAVGAEKAGKYIGMVGGGLGAAAALGLTASSVGLSVGIPVGLYGGLKLGRALYRRLWPSHPFDVAGMETEAKRRREGAMIVRAADRLRETYDVVGGDPGNPIVARLDALRNWAQDLSTLPHPDHTLPEVQAEWEAVRPETEEAIKVAQKTTNDRTPDIRAANSVGAQCTELGTRWATLPNTPPMPVPLAATIRGVQDMITAFVSPTPRYSLKSIEDAFKAAEAKFEDAWTKQLQRIDDVRKIGMFTAQCNELRNRWNTALPVTPPRPSLPSAVEGALAGIEAMVVNFVSATPSYTPSDVETAFAGAQEKYKTAWDKAVQRSEDMRKFTIYATRCTEMSTRWRALPNTPPVPGDLDAALVQAQESIRDFSSATPHYSAKEVEDAFASADTKFKAAWEKALKRSDAEIPELQQMGDLVLNNVNAIFASFPPANANHPAAQLAYNQARTARIAAQTTVTRLQSARSPEEATKQFEELRAQEDVVLQKIEEARTNVSRANISARQALAAARNMLAPDIDAMNDLPRRFQQMRQYTDRQLSEESAAKLRNAPASDLTQIWDRNRVDIARSRQEISHHLDTLSTSASWPKSDIGRLTTDFAGAFTAQAAPDFVPARMKAVLDDTDSRLKNSAQEAFAPLVGDLQSLRLVAGEGGVVIDRLITQCGSISNLPARNAIEQILRPYLDQTAL